MKNISQVLEFLGIQTSLENNYQIKSLYLDSRKCDSESAFIALKGQATDGNKYIDAVLDKGTKLVLSDDDKLSHKLASTSSSYFDSAQQSEEEKANIFYVENLKDKLPALARWFYDYKKPQNIIGITGTNGKTSISSYIAQLQKLLGQKSLLLGTNGNGIYPDLKESTHTTLDILSLYQIISEYSQLPPSYFDSAQQTEEEFVNLVMEVSSHSLDQKRTESLNFDVAVFSNLSHDHLDYHKTMDSYFEAKAKLFQFDNLRKAVINIDDEYGQKLCNICGCEVITVSLKSKNADIYLKSKTIENMQTSFDLYISQELIGTYQTALIGGFNLMNLGLSLAALDDNSTREQLLINISKVQPVKGRMEVVELKNSAKVIIDYAHTPDALEKALQTLASYNSNNLWCIFGCGGDRDTSKRPIMAQIAEKYVSKIVVTEDNNRFENIENIFSDIKKGFVNSENHTFIPSREEAIKYAIENSKAGDIIILAGKGHECYLDKNGVKEHFDEREIIAKYNKVSF
ncbi:UDP-N-acetylmuramoylalanyl-D-glutamate--2,6-diaminopimelate ligase [Candidatus Francisella endociliophora]|uniref:UDP-N-acetylmuramyl-tripeptide synthetase n=1 Tax=Candidatus Francisella endociliophora TaxID=653937 RepID=A0A097ENQ6_9GAMM|nr:UDP-N-acetylmuramoyl-L-alanyl-D-glutamate--2,6-diaminopimelate ligase [Francisella sp. FSC1006]AIT09196.1 UDP-N-acetylmuramoylalanyl-D-glutamate--2,6-diaminopimelate ligase [Francisella sp. FSC1006]